MEGIGRDHGIDKNSPDCNRRRRYPASILACDDMGGVFISPCNHTSGLSSDRIICLIYTKSDIFNNKNPDLVSRHAKKTAVLRTNIKRTLLPVRLALSANF